MQTNVTYRHQAGFSLVELLGAIAVTGALIGLSIASVQELKQKAFDASARSMVKNLGMGCEALMNEFATDPAATVAEYGIPYETEADGTIRITDTMGCISAGGSATCVRKLPGFTNFTSVSKRLTVGYVIADEGADVELVGRSVSMSSGGEGTRADGLDCVAVSRHARGTATYYWIPGLGLYSAERE